MGVNNRPLCTEAGGGCDYDHECCNGSCRNFICYSCKRHGDLCYKNSQCCSGYCTDFTCGPCKTNEQWMFSGLMAWLYIFILFIDVMAGQALYEGSMGVNNRPLCTEDGGDCEYDFDCCNASCKNLICQDCKLEGCFCFKNSQCCSGYCTDFTCGPCKIDGRWCAYNSDCCSGYCRDLTCGPCKENGSWCFLHSDCCSNLCVIGWFTCEEESPYRKIRSPSLASSRDGNSQSKLKKNRAKNRKSKCMTTSKV
ncbi:unnamed protein product, partial [Allacma fusca]